MMVRQYTQPSYWSRFTKVPAGTASQHPSVVTLVNLLTQPARRAKLSTEAGWRDS